METTQDTTTVETAVTSSPVVVPFYKNTQNLIAIVVAFILILGAGYYVYSTQYAHGGVVAIVNGEKIYRDELEKNIKGMESDAAQQGIDVTAPSVQEEIKKQSLQILIDSTLLIKTIKESGITATDAEVQEMYDMLAEQRGGEDALISELETIGITIEDLRTNLHERVLVDNYVTSLMSPESLEVTDADITTFLSAYEASELPPLESIRPQVIEQILLQRQQEVLSGVVEKIRAEAVIEEKI